MYVNTAASNAVLASATASKKTKQCLCRVVCRLRDRTRAPLWTPDAAFSCLSFLFLLQRCDGRPVFLPVWSNLFATGADLVTCWGGDSIDRRWPSVKETWDKGLRRAMRWDLGGGGGGGGFRMRMMSREDDER